MTKAFDRRLGRRRIVACAMLGLFAALMWAFPVFAQETSASGAEQEGTRTVRIITYGNHENLHRIAEVFEAEHPEINMEVETYGFNEYPEKIMIMMAGDAAPDIFQTWAQYKAQWVESGFLMDLTSFWSKHKDLAESFFPFIMQLVEHDGRYWGVPHDFNAENWYVVKDRFDAAGIPVPYDDWTVEEYRDYAYRLTDPRGRWLGSYNPVAFGGAGSLQWTRNWTGHGWVSEDLTKPMVDEPGQIEMLNFFLEIVTTGEAMNAGELTAPRDVFNGGYSMWPGWVDYSFRLASTDAYDFRLATIPRAAHGGNSLAQGHMWSIAKSAKNPDDALVFLEWLMSAKGQEALVTLDHRQPMSPDQRLWDIYFSQLPNDVRDHVRTFVLDTLYGQGRVDIMQYWNTWPEVSKVMVQHLGEVFTGEAAPSNAMAQAAQKIQAILDASR